MNCRTNPQVQKLTIELNRANKEISSQRKLISELQTFEKKSVNQFETFRARAKADKNKIVHLQQHIKLCDKTINGLKSDLKLQKNVSADLTNKFKKEKKAFAEENNLLMELYNTRDGPSLLLKETRKRVIQREQENLKNEKAWVEKYDNLRTTTQIQRGCLEKKFKNELVEKEKLLDTLKQLEESHSKLQKDQRIVLTDNVRLSTDYSLLKREIEAMKENPCMTNNRFETEESKINEMPKGKCRNEIELKQLKERNKEDEDILLETRKNRGFFSRKTEDRETGSKKRNAQPDILLETRKNRGFFSRKTEDRETEWKKRNARVCPESSSIL